MCSAKWNMYKPVVITKGLREWLLVRLAGKNAYIINTKVSLGPKAYIRSVTPLGTSSIVEGRDQTVIHGPPDYLL